MPLAVAATAGRVVATAVEAAAVCNPWLLSDLLVCGDLAVATVRCAAHNVRTNAPGSADEAEVEAMLTAAVASVIELADAATQRRASAA